MAAVNSLEQHDVERGHDRQHADAAHDVVEERRVLRRELLALRQDRPQQREQARAAAHSDERRGGVVALGVRRRRRLQQRHDGGQRRARQLHRLPAALHDGRVHDAGRVHAAVAILVVALLAAVQVRRAVARARRPEGALRRAGSQGLATRVLLLAHTRAERLPRLRDGRVVGDHVAAGTQTVGVAHHV